MNKKNNYISKKNQIEPLNLIPRKKEKILE